MLMSTRKLSVESKSIWPSPLDGISIVRDAVICCPSTPAEGYRTYSARLRVIICDCPGPSPADMDIGEPSSNSPGTVTIARTTVPVPLNIPTRSSPNISALRFFGADRAAVTAGTILAPTWFHPTVIS